MSMQAGAEFLYVADPMCSWCWGFSPVFDGVQAHFGDRLTYRMVMGGLRPGPSAQELDDHLRATLQHHWQAVAERSGQPFNEEGLARKDWLYDTEPPSRAVVTMREVEPSAEIPFFKSLQRAFYAEAIDVVDETTYPALIERLEMAVDPDIFMQRFRSDEMQKATWADFRHARELGIGGFPSVIVAKGDEMALLTRGWAPLERLVPALEGWLDR